MATRPIVDGYITSPYGERILNGVKQFHHGIDISSHNPTLPDVVAAYDGVIRWIDNDHPVYDPKTQTVAHGYGVLQPRVAISLPSANRSWFSRFFSGDPGIDPYTRLATLDPAKLDLQIASNKQGVVNTVQEFGANFAKSASLLVSAGNFFSKQLGNLDHGIHFIADNKASLQQEFGTGEAAGQTGQITTG